MVSNVSEQWAPKLKLGENERGRLRNSVSRAVGPKLKLGENERGRLRDNDDA